MPSCSLNFSCFSSTFAEVWKGISTFRMINTNNLQDDKRSPFSLSQTPSAIFKSVCPSHLQYGLRRVQWRVSHLLLTPHFSKLLLAPHLKSLEPHLILWSPCFVEWWILWYSLSSLSVLLLIIHNDLNFLSATPKFPHAKPKLPNASP